MAVTRQLHPHKMEQISSALISATFFDDSDIFSPKVRNISFHFKILHNRIIVINPGSFVKHSKMGNDKLSQEILEELRLVNKRTREK
ncbi:MAG: hypothetical protein Q4D62_15845 [Planctomycetia bacterium]|nr:hypothetical protein [Planctomycetia bacterium]